MPRNALEIADEFIRRSGNTKTNMQIQKMVYIAHGYMLGAYGRPLISENVEAWRWGPVIPSLYKRFKKYGSDLITAKPGRRPNFDAEEERVLEYVWGNYGKYCGYYLSQITHGKESDDKTPWKNHYVDGSKVVIPDHSIWEYYRVLCKEGK